MIVDTNILLALIHEVEGPIGDKLADLQSRGDMYVNPVIFAELSPNFATCDDLSGYLSGLGMAVEAFTLAECHRAGQAFAEYRRRGGARETILPDFLVGAQAAMRGWPLVTRDRKGFASYFPEVELIDPYEAQND